MTKKEKNQAVINELKANNKWEQVHRERDRLKVERIKNLGMRSKLDVLIGGLICFAAYNGLLDMVNIMNTNVKEKGASSIQTLVSGIAPNAFGRVLVVAVLGLIFFFFAMSKNETIDKMTSARYVWMPDDKEVEYINNRFDNDFVRSVLAVLSSEDTHSIETGLEAVTVNNNTGSEVFNYNNCGYRRLTNYDTKQLSYYLASQSFPEGFEIYQTKITPVGSEKFIGGTTNIGGEQPPAEDEEKRNMKLLAGLYEQLSEFVRIKNPFKMYLKEEGPSDVNNGQIVLNKGFISEKEGYADL